MLVLKDVLYLVQNHVLLGGGEEFNMYPGIEYWQTCGA